MRILLSALLFSLCLGLHAEEWEMTIQEFLMVTKGEPDENNQKQYVKAYWIAANVLVKWRGQGHCAPQGVTNGQAVEITKKLFQDHPESWHEPASAGVSIALEQLWPCDKAETPTKK